MTRYSIIANIAYFRSVSICTNSGADALFLTGVKSDRGSFEK